jgi:hypothetical protein
MNDLTLKAGGRLVANCWKYDNATGTGESVELDISDCASAHLFYGVTVDHDVTLADVFRLLAADPVLQAVHANCFAQELCEEAAKGATDGADTGSPDALDYLELYQTWEVDTSTSTYAPHNRLSLHGVGVVQRADRPEMARRAGERIEWDVSLTPLRALLALPVRIKPEVVLYEGNPDADAYGQELARLCYPHLTLGEVLDSLLRGLTVYGSPAQQNAVTARLKAQHQAIRAGTAKLIPHEELFAAFDRGLEAMFDSTGRYTLGELEHALQGLDPKANVAEALAAVLGTSVVVRAPYRSMAVGAFRLGLPDIG